MQRTVYTRPRYSAPCYKKLLPGSPSGIPNMATRHQLVCAFLSLRFFYSVGWQTLPWHRRDYNALGHPRESSEISISLAHASLCLSPPSLPFPLPLPLPWPVPWRCSSGLCCLADAGASVSDRSNTLGKRHKAMLLEANEGHQLCYK